MNSRNYGAVAGGVTRVSMTEIQRGTPGMASAQSSATARAVTVLDQSELLGCLGGAALGLDLADGVDHGVERE
jgi:hypothetical protein